MLAWQSAARQKTQQLETKLLRAHTPDRLHPRRPREKGSEVHIINRFVDAGADPLQYQSAVPARSEVEDRLYDYHFKYEKDRKEKSELYFTSVKIGSSIDPVRLTKPTSNSKDKSALDHTRPFVTYLDKNKSANPFHNDYASRIRHLKEQLIGSAAPQTDDLYESKHSQRQGQRAFQTARQKPKKAHKLVQLPLQDESDHYLSDNPFGKLRDFKRKQSVEKRKPFFAAMLQTQSLMNVDQPDFVSLNAQPAMLEPAHTPRNLSLSYTKELKKSILRGDLDAED